MSNIPPCPRCGHNAGFLIKARMVGTGLIFYDNNGIEGEVDIDKSSLVPYSSAVRCENCERIRRDITCINDKIVPKQT